MEKRALPLLSLLALVACTAGTATLPPGSGSPSGSSTSSTEPEAPASSGSSDKGSTTLGPSCTEYLACCAELAGKTPQLAASCDAVNTQIETAQKNGVSTSSYESACKSGVASLKNAGYCKPAVNEKKCVPSCTQDSDCANSCPTVAGGIACCDAITGSCFGTKTSSCPKPEDAGGDPPPSY